MSLYRILGFWPRQINLYRQALTHRSSTNGNGKIEHNERLEFLGDAILDAIVADILYQRFPDRKEGFMTDTRSKIVQRESLNRIALAMQLDRLIVSSTRSHSHNNYMYGNALEALIGAIYLDCGYRKCFDFVQRRIIDVYVPIDTVVRREVNFKSTLIEWSQKNKLAVTFELQGMQVDHDGNALFRTSVWLPGIMLGTGEGYTKKESQQQAARAALRKLRSDKEVRRRVSELKRPTADADADAPDDIDGCPDE